MKQAVLVAGICGRMGSKVAELAAKEPGLELVGGVERAGHPCAGDCVTFGGTSVQVFSGFSAALPETDLVVDFTSAAGTQEALAFCLGRTLPLVTGTTGHSDEDLEKLKQASCSIPVLVSPNMSAGITLLSALLPGLLRMAGEPCDVEIVEKHHRAKKDSPSGTAIRLAQTLAGAKGHDVVMHSIRAGDVVGEHTIILGLRDERIEIKHVVESRDCFAHGTVAAVKFLLGKPPGWYTMNDVVAGSSVLRTDDRG